MQCTKAVHFFISIWFGPFILILSIKNRGIRVAYWKKSVKRDKVGNKCNRAKGHGIIYPNDVIKKLIYSIKNVRIAYISNFQRRPFPLLHLLLGNKRIGKFLNRSNKNDVIGYYKAI